MNLLQKSGMPYVIGFCMFLVMSVLSLSVSLVCAEGTPAEQIREAACEEGQLTQAGEMIAGPETLREAAEAENQGMISFGAMSVAQLNQESVEDAEIQDVMPADDQTVQPESEEDFIEDDPFAKDEEVLKIADPLYPWNKAMYHFNDKFFLWILKPVSKGYSKVLPEDIRTAFGNFFHNLLTPVRFVNNLLQLRMKDAGNELVRVVVNSTVGVGGLADVAKDDMEITAQNEDFGQTLGSYGLGHGFYLVWPFIGPSSLRDTVGFVGDWFLDPVYYVNPMEASVGIKAFDVVNKTSFVYDDYEEFKKDAYDPYLFFRDAYIQHRDKKVNE
jgi:phospholipid-binding lipoprotein MlaA